ncbi:deoxyribonuclease NucA/NucB [Nonomuraea fuscirosea]|uniref:Deoxyribonuclease NucA/NucB n=3 Tax=Nonomuraea fuscirosea TaxID=1291556 RepID=A0A2T0MYC9_9ACTN|nr:deoxyribonuclease NucA/NucB [Nonomuraea fuscirosea]
MMLPLSLMSAPAIAHSITSPPTTRTTSPSAPITPTSKALEQAKKDNRRVEIESMRSESATFYANPDGKTVRMELSTQPTRVKNANGKGFTPVDTTLVEADGVIKPKAAHGGLVLSAGQNKTLLKSQAANATAKITTPSVLPEPRLEGNTATYPDAYGEGRDLLVTANVSGFQQQITIAERPTGPVSFRVPVDLPEGLSFKTNAAGRPEIVGKDGKTLTEVRPTLLQDAKAADTGAPLDAGRVGKAAVTLADDGKTLVFTPDAAFLADPATAYPVTVTAAVSDWYEGHTGKAGGMDTWINDYDYQDSWDTFYQTQIVVGKSYASSIAKRWRGYLKFPDIPAEFAGSKVENADLQLWNYQSNECGVSVGSGITARQITSYWEDTRLLWNSQPSVISTGADTEFGAYSEDCTGSMNYAWDLTHTLNDIVQAWVDGATNYGIQLTAGNESELRNWRRYTSEDAGGCMTPPLEDCKGQLHPPILTVDFEMEGPVEEVVMLTGTQLTNLPEYEDAIAMSMYQPLTSNEDITISNEVASRIAAQRDGQGYQVDASKLDFDESGIGGTGDGEDTGAPRVIAVEPEDGAVDVPLDPLVKVTFSEPVGEAQVIVKDASGTQVTGTLAYDSTETVLTFEPEQALKAGTAYTVELSGAMDSWENIMAPYTWSFTTLKQSAAQWTFDEGDGRTAADSSGNDHDASLNDTAAWIAGKSGSAISNVPSQARIAASRTAAKQGKAVEITDETTATSITYAQPDGKTFKTEVTAGPVRTKQGSGWTPIDTTLAEQGGKLRPKALVEGAIVEISVGGTDPFVKMAADGKSYALRWPTPLPKPTVKGSVATYTDAAGVGADLVVTALPTGFRHEVVLRQRPAKQVELRIGVEDEGLTLTEGKGGRLLLKGKDKKLVAAGTRPTVVDGSGENRPAMAKRGKVGGDVVTKDGRTELVVKPDQKFLADDTTTYPVRVASVVALPVGADVEVNTFDTDYPAYSDNEYLMAGTMSDGSKYRTHLQFDTIGLQGGTVTDATLSMNTVDAHNCGAALARGIQVARLTSGWDQDDMYWDTKPTLTTEDASTNFKGVNADCDVWPDSMEWNVTGIAQDWAAGATNHGLVLKSPGEANVENYRMFTSSEYLDTDGYPPMLTITTSGPASEPAVSAPAITPAHTVDGVTVTTSLTPQLAAIVTDTIGGNLTGEFEVEHDPAATGQGSGQIWAGASAEVASGEQVTVGVPAAMLTDGWKIRWRVRAANAAASSVSGWSNWQTATVDVPNPTLGAFQVIPSQVVDGITVATSLTPAVHATVTDPAAQPLRAEFEFEHDPAATGQGVGQIWTGAVDNVASGSQASAIVPTGKLIDGWKVRWRARALNTTTTVGSPWSDWQNLTVDVPDPVSEPAVGALQVTPSEQVNGTTVSSTRTPSLLAQVNDPAGKPLRAEAEIEHDPAAPDGQGSGQIWAGGADNVPAGTQASITVPADELADGWKVRWRARAVSTSAASAWSDWQSFTISLPKPTATGLAVTPSKVVDGVTVTTKLTPTLRATLTHPTGQALRAEAEIEHDPAAPDGQGSGQIWAGAVDDVASGTEASITVPGNSLTDGWKVRWRLRVTAGDVSSAWSDWQPITVDVTQPGEEPLAQTDGPVIRTDESFTAAAWLRWSDKDGDFTVLEQRGAHQAPFRLGNTADQGLVFTFTGTDAVDAPVEGVLSGVEAPVNDWFHLTGVYDATTKTAALYLNGVLVKSESLSASPWHADSAMTVGTRMQGDLDEVHLYQRSLTADDVAALFARMDAVNESSSAQLAPPNTATPKAGTAVSNFDNDHISLENCYKTPPAYGKPEMARIQEHPYASCWSAYYAIGAYADDDDSTKKLKRGAKIPVVRIAAELADIAVDSLTDDMIFSFRATWVLHSYLGNAAGDGVVGGDSTTKPQHVKAFVRLQEFGVFQDGVRQTRFDRGLQQMNIGFDLTVSSSTSSRCEVDGNSDHLKSISSWESTSHVTVMVRGYAGADKKNAVCTIKPLITSIGGVGYIGRLWSQDVLDREGKRVGVYRNGDPPPAVSTVWAPNFRCDWQTLGKSDNANDGVPDHTGGCINTRANRVWTMSKKASPNFVDVIEHIEDAMDPSENIKTYPPLRQGDTTASRDPEYPPAKEKAGTLLSKAIPGNWEAAPNTPAGKPLHRGTAKDEEDNRAIFSKHQFWSDYGDPDKQKFWRASRTTNYCKYYEYDEKFKDNYTGVYDCDEYPYATTKQGAAKDRLNYSVRGIDLHQNRSHGGHLTSFYAQYRLTPDEVGDNAEDSPFWMMVVD